MRLNALAISCTCWIIPLMILQLQTAALKCRQYAMVRSAGNFSLLHQLDESAKSQWPPGAKWSSYWDMVTECAERCRDRVDAVALISALADNGLPGTDAINLLQAQKAYLVNEDECAGESGACLDYYYEAFQNEDRVSACRCFAVILIMRVHKAGKNCKKDDVIKRLDDRFAPFGFRYYNRPTVDDVHCGARGANACKLKDPVGFRKTDVCSPWRDYSETMGV